MNRLVLIGNGFDLAHGLKTSYSDFIHNYLFNAIVIYQKVGSYDDVLLSIEDVYNGTKAQLAPVTLENVMDTFQEIKTNRYFKVIIKSRILEHSLYSLGELNWVDLENLYFELLIKQKVNNKFSEPLIMQLNKEFEYVKEKLEIFLSDNQVDKEGFKPDDDIFNVLNQKLMREDFPFETLSIHAKIENIQFLNFNYTNTLNFYTQKFDQKNCELNHIHGELNSSSNPIIFGFGDEINSQYKLFKEEETREIFRHIKSYAYLRTTSYQNLYRFINNGKYQIFIVGHSCGLSDRTMLSLIFEHKNCSSVKIFYYNRPDGTNDFNDKCIDIARHFTDQGRMRLQIVSLPNSNYFPQFKQNSDVIPDKSQ